MAMTVSSPNCEAFYEETRARLEGSDEPYERAVLRALDALGPDALWAMVVDGVGELPDVADEAQRFAED